MGPPVVTARAGRASALPAEERRAAIVLATLPLLYEHGEMVTTRQIAKACGIAEGTIFRVFADKDELLSATLEAAMDMAALEATLTAIDPDLDFEGQVLAAADAIGKRVADIWQLVSNLGPRLQRQARRPFRDSAAMTAIFERNADRITVEPAEAARFLRATLISMNHPLVGGTASVEHVVDLVLHGVLHHDDHDHHDVTK